MVLNNVVVRRRTLNRKSVDSKLGPGPELKTYRWIELMIHDTWCGPKMKLQAVQLLGVVRVQKPALCSKERKLPLLYNKYFIRWYSYFKNCNEIFKLVVQAVLKRFPVVSIAVLSKLCLLSARWYLFWTPDLRK